MLIYEAWGNGHILFLTSSRSQHRIFWVLSASKETHFAKHKDRLVIYNNCVTLEEASSNDKYTNDVEKPEEMKGRRVWMSENSFVFAPRTVPAATFVR